MKYIYYVLFILIALSALIYFKLVSDEKPVGKSALEINERVVTVEEFESLYSGQKAYPKEDFINSIITKELLIQEARRMGIDREEPFRKSIKNFYEQSLIKILVDRKFKAMETAVEEKELDEFVSLMGKRLRMTMFEFESRDEAETGPLEGGKTKAIDFRDLSTEMQAALVGLKNGERSRPVGINGRHVVIRVEGFGPARHPPPSPKEREMARKMLEQERKQRLLNEWMDGLRRESDIKVFVD